MFNFEKGIINQIGDAWKSKISSKNIERIQANKSVKAVICDFYHHNSKQNNPKQKPKSQTKSYHFSLVPIQVFFQSIINKHIHIKIKFISNSQQTQTRVTKKSKSKQIKTQSEHDM